MSSRILSFNVFHGYPAWVIAQWCGVSLSTARAYKSGKRRPPRPVLRLWSLYRDRRVLGSEWEGWLIQANTLVDPDGNVTTLNQLRAYCFVMQLAAAQARELGPDAQDRFYEVVGRISAGCMSALPGLLLLVSAQRSRSPFQTALRLLQSFAKRGIGHVYVPITSYPMFDRSTRKWFILTCERWTF